MSTAQLKQTSVPVSSRYGPRILNGRANVHKGTDFPFGSAMGVSAFGSGTVVHVGRGSGGNAERGIYVQIRHADGIETSYHSLSRATVKQGQWVNMGDIIGYGGKTATGATGNHVHVGLWLNGSHVNLENYLTPGKVVTVSNSGAVTDGGSTPFPNDPAPAPAQGREDDMYLHWDTGGTGWFVNNSAWVAVSSPQHMALLRRMIAGKEDTFLRAEVDIMHSYIHQANEISSADFKPIHNSFKKIGEDLNYIHVVSPDSLKNIHTAVKGVKPTVDTAAIAKAVTDAVKAQIDALDIQVAIDYQKIASTVAALQGEALTNASQ